MAFLTYVKSTTASWTNSSADLVVFGIFKDQTMTSIGNEINKHLNNVVKKKYAYFFIFFHIFLYYYLSIVPTEKGF